MGNKCEDLWSTGLVCADSFSPKSQGAEAAAAVSRPPTNRLRTGKPAAQWVTVYDPRLPMKQRWVVSAMAEACFCFFAQRKNGSHSPRRAPPPRRCHHNVPEELLPGFIAKDKEQKLFITSVASCADKWALIADEGNQFGSQVHKISQELLPKVHHHHHHHHASRGDDALFLAEK